MPYITQERRNSIAEKSDDLLVAGELNYALTRLLLTKDLTPTSFVVRVNATILDYLRNKNLNYQTINDIMGAIVGSLFEYKNRMGVQSPMEGPLFQVLRDFYQEVAVPYEKIKIAQNGDVYDVK